MTFNGFISYSHAADGRLAPAVQRGLHRLAKPWHRRRALWIFRDQTGLAVTPALWSSIQKALDGSDYFVLLASPEAARSTWVDREIEHWIATKSADRILPVVTDGEWHWDREGHDFTADSTAVPAALRGVFTEEPLFLDLRWARDSEQLSLQHSRFRDAIAQLAAPMHGVSKDELEGEDVRQHRRARRLRSGAVATLVVLTLLAALTSLSAVQNADRARDAASEALRQQRVADVQRGSAERSAQEALRQQELAKQQQVRAADAATEASDAERVAQQQQTLADQAAAEAERQEQLADQAAKRTAEQQRLAREASGRAQQLEKEAEKLQQEARRLEKEQQRLQAEAQRLGKIAEERRRLAEEGAAEAEKQQANADKQQRIAVSRRLVNQARAAVGNDPKTALMLAAAATRVRPATETRAELTGLVTATNFAGRLDDVTVTAYGPDGVLAALGINGLVSLWNVADPTSPARIVTLPGAVEAGSGLVFSTDKRTLALVSAEGTAVLWNVTDPAGPVRIATLASPGRVRSFAFSGDGTMFGTGDRRGITRIWDMTVRTRPALLSTITDYETYQVQDLTFSADGHWLVTNKDRFMPIYDLTDRAHPVANRTLPVFSASTTRFSPAGSSLLALGSAGGKVGIYDLDLSDEEQTGSNLTGLTDRTTALEFSSDGRMVAAGQADGTAVVWGLGRSAGPAVKVRAYGGVASVTLAPDNRTLVTTDTSRTATLWNLAPRGVPDPLATVPGSGGSILATAYRPDGRTLVTADSRATVSTWDMKDPARPVRGADLVLQNGAEVSAVAFSPDTRTVAAVGRQDRRLTLTETSRPGRPVTLATLGDGSGGVNTMAFSPDGRTLAVVDSTARVLIWDVRNRALPALVATLGDGVVFGRAVAFSPDGRTLATGGEDRTVTAWNLADLSGPVRHTTMRGHGNTVHSVAFSPDGHTLASASSDSTAILWDVTDPGRPYRLSTLTGHSSNVWTVAFSTDGRTLATSGDGNPVILWDTAGPAEPIRLAAIPTGVTASARVLSPDGQTLAGLGPDYKSVALWSYRNLNSMRAAPADYACTITGRGLTAAEWARFIPEFPYERTCR